MDTPDALKFRYGKIKSGKQRFAEVHIELKEKQNGLFNTIQFQLNGDDSFRQGHLYSITNHTCADWKVGVEYGIHLGLKKVQTDRKYEITIVEALGDILSSNPMTFAYAGLMIIIENFDNNLTGKQIQELEKTIFDMDDKSDYKLQFEKITATNSTHI